MWRAFMRDPSTVDEKFVVLIRELARRADRPASEEEARAALAGLKAGEQARLLQHGAGAPPARPLSVQAWADVARGASPETAAARELTGYYTLLAERDALAQVHAARASAAQVKPARARAAGQGATSGRRAKAGQADTSIPPHIQDDADDAGAPAQVALSGAKPVEAKPLPPRSRKSRAESSRDGEAAAKLLTLFAYHRDKPLVARAMGWSLADLDAEVQRLGIKSQAGKLLRGLDTELPAATARKSAKETQPVLRRSAGEKARAQEEAARVRALAALAAKPEAPEPQPEPRFKRLPGKPLAEKVHPGAKHSPGEAKAVRRVEARGEAKVERLALPKGERRGEKLGTANIHAQVKHPEKPARVAHELSAAQGDELRAILRELGPRRNQLAARLGSSGKPLSHAAVLARFRAAGLEREFGQRERDLVRALLSRHRGSLAAAAGELALQRHELEALVRERGLAKEVEAQREEQRAQVRAAAWPKARLKLLLERADWLADLGLREELAGEARAKLAPGWTGLTGDKAKALAGQLGLQPGEARALAALLGLK